MKPMFLSYKKISRFYFIRVLENLDSLLIVFGEKLEKIFSTNLKK